MNWLFRSFNWQLQSFNQLFQSFNRLLSIFKTKIDQKLLILIKYRSKWDWNRDCNWKSIEFISKSWLSIQYCRWNRNQIIIGDRIWTAWNPKHRRFDSGGLLALAYHLHTPCWITWSRYFFYLFEIINILVPPTWPENAS